MFTMKLIMAQVRPEGNPKMSIAKWVEVCYNLDEHFMCDLYNLRHAWLISKKQKDKRDCIMWTIITFLV